MGIQTSRNKETRKRRLRRRRAMWRRTFGSKALWIQHQRCIVCGATPCEAAHVKSRGAGGTKADLVPMCPCHHRDQHDMGVLTFERTYDVDLRELADWWEARWQEVAAGGQDLPW